MTGKIKTCKNCDAFRILYRLCPSGYYKSGGGYCAVRGEWLIDTAACRAWREKDFVYDVSPERFAEVERDVSYISEHLKDD